MSRLGRFLLTCVVFVALAASLLGPSSAPKPGPPVVSPSTRLAASGGAGYWFAAADGGVFSFGDARFAGSAGGAPLVARVVGMAATPTGRGYWLVASDGGVFTYGDAVFAGSTGGVRLAAPIVAIMVTPTGQGYWLVAADGGVFTFGDAAYFGSAAGRLHRGPVSAAVASPSGRGYWLVSSVGEVFPFGDAGWHGDASKLPLARPIVAAASTPSGQGYWLAASDGGIFTYGDAGYFGSTGHVALVAPIVGMAPTASGGGYWLIAADGGVFTFGDAPFRGSTGATRLVAPIVSATSTPTSHGTGVAAFYYPWYATQSRDGAWRHWDQGGHTPPDDIGSDYYPSRGAYSSNDPAILDGQFAEIAAAGIDEVVVSWWGQGSFEDHALGGVLAAASAHGVHVAVHLEPYVGRSPATVASDLAYLSALGLHEVWIYEAMLLPGASLQPVLDAFPGDRFMAETGTVSAVRSGAFAQWAAATHFAGVYTYEAVRYEGADLVAFCAGARRLGLACAPAVAPGFSSIRAGGGPTYARSRANGATYDSRWMGAIGAHPSLVAITSYNEWHEGTQIEPAVDKCLPSGFCYLSYDGAYGLQGAAASTAYLNRTATWVARFRAAAP
jgi:hypothetical protein